VIFFSDTVEKFIPPAKGKTHTLRIIRELIDFQPQSRKTNIAEALRFFTSFQKRRAIAFVLSDFRDLNYRDALQIMSRKHDVTGIQIFDERERELPALGIIPMKDPETGQIAWVNTSSAKIQQRVRQRFAQHQKYFVQSFTKSGAGQLSINVNESYAKQLLGYFKKRSA